MSLETLTDEDIHMDILSYVVNVVKCHDEFLDSGEMSVIYIADFGLTNLMSRCHSEPKLNASCSFLEEGVELLSLAFDKLNKEGKSGKTTNDHVTCENQPGHGFQILLESSKERFASAQDCFRESRDAATFVFHNESVSIKDRIMAAKLRLAARILESSLEEPDVAAAYCLLYLKELHDLPATQEMFAVFLKGGLKSMWKKAERSENITSILFMNRVLFDFASKCNEKSKIVFTWPIINLADRTFHPIEHAHEILTQKKGKLEKSLLLHKFDPGHKWWERDVKIHPSAQVTVHIPIFPITRANSLE